MSFLDDIVDSLLGGEDRDSDSKTKTSGSSTSTDLSRKQQDTVSGKQTQQQTTTEAQAQQRGTQTSQQYNFTPEQLAAMNRVILDTSGVGNVYGAETLNALRTQGGITGNIAARAAGGVDVSGVQNAAARAAQLAYQEETLPQINQLADVIGSKNNSAIMLMKQKGASDLATKIANVVGQIGLQGEDLTTQLQGLAASAAGATSEASRAYEIGSSQAIADRLAALSTAKGGTIGNVADILTSGTTSQASLERGTEEQGISDVTQLATTSRGESTGTQVGSGSTSSSGSLLNLLQLLLQPSGGRIAA